SEYAPSWSGGVRRAALVWDQHARYEVMAGQRVLMRNGAPPAEVRALLPYELWEAEQASGLPANIRGKSDGDGLMPPEQFYMMLEAGLSDCRSTKLSLERLARGSGLDRGTLKKYLADPAYGPPWPLLKKQRTLAKCEALGWQRPTGT